MSDTPSWRLPIERAIAEMTDKSLDGDVFLRSMMHHDAWLVPGRSTAKGVELGVISTPKGRILEVYSDADQLQRMELKEGAEFTGEILRMEGYELFSALAALQVDRLNVNPAYEPKISWRGEQIELLVAWAKQAAVELAVLEPERVRDPLGTLASYESYYVVYENYEDAHSIVLAPDNQSRSLAAVFTSWDCVEAFRSAMQSEASGVLEAAQLPAVELFPLVQRLDVQGMVFNPWTHLPPRALSAAFLDRVMPRLQSVHLH